MKILMLGDQANVAIQLSKGLGGLGHEVWHVLLDTSDVRMRVPTGPTKGVEVVWSRPALLSLLERSVRLCREIDFEVIHSHWITSFGIAGSASSLLSSGKHIAHFHGDDIRRARLGLRSHLRTRIGACTCECALYSTPDLHDMFFLNKQARYLPNPVDTSAFREIGGVDEMRESLLKGREILLLAPGRFDLATKNQDILVEAVRSPEFGNVQTLFMSATAGGDYEELVRLARRAGVEHRVSFIVGVGNKEMPAYYSCADVVAVGFKLGVYGCAVTEAMACSRPVICHFDYPRYGKYVHERPPLVEGHDVPSVSRSISELIADPRLRRRVGKDSQAWVRREHSLESVTKRLASIYSHVLG